MTPEQAKALREKRYAKVLAAIARWEAKQKRARNALRKLARQRAYYFRVMYGTEKPEPTARELEHKRANAKAVRHIKASAKQKAIVLDVLAKAIKATPAERGHDDMLGALVRDAAKRAKAKGRTPRGASAPSAHA